MHILNTVCPLHPEVSDWDIPLLLPLFLRQFHLAFAFGFGLPSMYGATCENFGVITHVRGGECLTCKVGNPIMELVVTCRDEAALLVVKGV